MSASMHDGAEPNLTPMLDMVFQLVTFFMLVINFKGAAMDLSLKLPVLGSARPLDTKGKEDVIVLNIDQEGHLNVYGKQQDVRQYITKEARLSAMNATSRNAAFKSGDELPTMVVVRADKATPFKLLNEVIDTCRKNNFRKFSLKVVNREERR